MNEAFQSEFKSSQVDFLFLFYDEIFVVIFYRELRIQNWTVKPFVFKIDPLHGPHVKHRLPLLWMHVYRYVAWQQTFCISTIFLGVDSIENSLVRVTVTLWLAVIVLTPNGLRITTRDFSGLPPVSSSWRQTAWGSRPEIFQLNPCGHSPYVTSSLTRGRVCVLWIGFAFVKCSYRTYGMLLKILPCALHTNPLSVQALQSRSCIFYLSYATTAS
jgi:hypothetical protein